MITLQRLNQDTTWKIELNGYQLLQDPWLVESEIDGFSWFNEQWHRTEPVPIEALQDIDCIVVSQPFSDHCHEKTIARLPAHWPIAAVAPARKRLEKTFQKTRDIRTIPTYDAGFLPLGALQLTQFRTASLLDQVHNALLIVSPTQENIFYAPHGFVANAQQLAWLKDYPIEVLITTASLYKLPFYLGGTVNLGLSAMRKLADQLQPRHVISTHDEQKIAKGLVPRIAQTFYPDAFAVKKIQSNFIPIDDYRIVTI
jgi:L-ascorbate metabolism protein UlaG (beta-lactamase superfamily)